MPVQTSTAADPLAAFSPATATWFAEVFAAPTAAQAGAWQAISSAASDVYKRQGGGVPDADERAAQVAFDIDGERLHRRDVDCLLYTSPSPRDS